MPCILQHQNINEEEFKIEPIKWGNINIVAFKKFWKSDDFMAPFFEKQLKANEKFIRGILSGDISLMEDGWATKLMDITDCIFVTTDDKKESEKNFLIFLG